MAEAAAGRAASPRFALVVVNYGSSDLLASNLGPMDLSPIGGRIVVVDNFTSVPERAAIAALARRRGWRLLPLEENRGFGGGVNIGVSAAIAEGAGSIVVLNPDATIASADLSKLVEAVENDPGLLAAPVIRRGDGTVWFDGVDMALDSGRMASARRMRPLRGPRRPWITGACFAMSCRLWERVGGFDEDYFLYWEDVDLSHRVVDAGGRLAVLHELCAVHDEGGTQEAVTAAGKSEVYYFYNIRNRLVYAAKHLDGRRLRRWLWLTPKVSYEILRGGGRRQFLHSVAPVRAYLAGIRDGVFLVRSIRRASTDRVPREVGAREIVKNNL